MNRRNLLKLICSIPSLLIFPHLFEKSIDENKIKIFLSVLNNFQNNFNPVKLDESQQNNFYNKVMAHNFKSERELKKIISKKIIKDYQEDNIKLCDNKFISITEYNLYSFNT